MTREEKISWPTTAAALVLFALNALWLRAIVP
jgi:hypothetical protein